MKNMTKNFVFFSVLSIFFTNSGNAVTGHEQDPHYEWIEASNVAIQEDGIYIDTVKGMMKLNAMDYDPINDRNQVKCRCLEDLHLDPSEALRAPYEGTRE